MVRCGCGVVCCPRKEKIAVMTYFRKSLDGVIYMGDSDREGIPIFEGSNNSTLSPVGRDNSNVSRDVDER